MYDYSSKVKTRQGIKFLYALVSAVGVALALRVNKKEFMRELLLPLKYCLCYYYYYYYYYYSYCYYSYCYYYYYSYVDADNKLVLNGLTRDFLNCFVSTFFDFSAERLERLLISAERSDSTALDQNLLSVDACVTISAKSRLGKQ